MSARYAFVDAECATLAGDEACAPTVTQTCEWLGISKSGYYEWRSRPQSAAAKRRELKTHQRGPGNILRSRKPELIEQEIWGLLLTHYGIRHLMREAAD